MNKNTAMALMMAGMAASAGVGIDSLLPYQLRKPEKPYRTCSLTTCENLTNHNGGYCCAEHSKEHRKLRRNR